MHQPDTIAFMQGDSTPEVLAEVRAAMMLWAKQTDEKPLGLNRCIGLGTPRTTRITLRDSLLREAAALLSGSRWARCRQLAELARAFNTRRWPTWRCVGVPGDASAVDVLLFRACELGEPLPESPERFLSVLP
jgi:hypothetical protein